MKTLPSLSEGKSIVQLVLQPSWVTRINAIAAERGVNRSALIREAIAQTYFEKRAGGREGEESPERKQA